MGTGIEGITITPLKQIKTQKGDVFHALKASEESFSNFGEAYFSFVNKNAIKGWKKHSLMRLNLIVPVGSIRFVFFDDRSESKTKGIFKSIVLGPEKNYCRLTVNPGVWMAFRGLEDLNCLLNIASIPHDPNEAINVDLNEIGYDW